MKWYRFMADLGSAAGQTNLGLMYVNGKGTPQDYTQAAKWFQLAAAQNNANAQSSLGAMYAEGAGVPQDYVLAHMWSNLAAAHGDATAAKHRDLDAQKMTPNQISQAQQLARNWKPTPRK